MTDPAREAAERIEAECKNLILSPFGEDALTLARAYLALPTAGDREALAKIIRDAYEADMRTMNGDSCFEERAADAILASGFRRDGVRPEWRLCKDCGGRGEVCMGGAKTGPLVGDVEDQYGKCPSCNGTGARAALGGGA